MEGLLRRVAGETGGRLHTVELRFSLSAVLVSADL